MIQLFPKAMKNRPARLPLAGTMLLALVLLASPVATSAQQVAFGFHAGNVSGLSGEVRINGGGVGDHLGGGFTCLQTVANLGGQSCLEGQGVRWDTAAVLESTAFKCLPSDLPMTATTGDDTIVLSADFYRAIGGPPGASEEFTTANMIIAKSGLPGHPEFNVWIQGVGCGTAVGNVN